MATAGTTFYVEIAFTTNPADTPVWTDVSSYVRQVTVNRGRNRELDQVQAGRATIILDNRDRRFDPSHTAGPYYGNILPMRRIRIRATYAATTATLFSGYVDGWDQNYDYPREANVAVSATDGFKVLTAARLSGSVWQNEVVADNPYAWWRFDEPASSTVVFEETTKTQAAVLGTPTFGSASLLAGTPGGSIKLSKADTNGAVQITSGPIVPSAFPFTIECWFQIPASETPAVNNYLFYVRSASGSVNVIWPSLNVINGDRIRFGISGRSVDSSVGSIVTDTTYHVVAIANSATSLTLYINNSTAGTTESGGTGTVPSPISAMIGNDEPPHSSGNYVFPGYIDELVVYDTALSAARVSAHYNAGTNPWAGDLSGTRVGRVLDEIGWPTTDRSVDTGDSTLIAETDWSGTALSKLQQIEASENGLLFITVDGKVRFRSRRNAWIAPYTTVQGTFGDGSGELDYTDIDYEYDDTQIYNDIRVTRDGGAEQRVEDAASQTAYLIRTLSRTGLQIQSDSESLDNAHQLLARYKDAALRVKQLTVQPQKDPTNLYPQILSREIGDRLRILRRPQNIGSAVDQEVIIEGLQHTITPETWTTTYQVSPLDALRYWLLGTAGNSELGSTTRLGY